MEKFFMVIIICVGQACEGIWQNTTYPSIDDCLAASPIVKEYFMATLPESSGQIFCLVEEEFNKCEESSKEAIKKINQNIDSSKFKNNNQYKNKNKNNKNEFNWLLLMRFFSISLNSD